MMEMRIYGQSVGKLIDQTVTAAYGTKYSRIDQVKFVEDSL